MEKWLELHTFFESNKFNNYHYMQLKNLIDYTLLSRTSKFVINYTQWPLQIIIIPHWSQGKNNGILDLYDKNSISYLATRQTLSRWLMWPLVIVWITFCFGNSNYNSITVLVDILSSKSILLDTISSLGNLNMNLFSILYTPILISSLRRLSGVLPIL